MTAVRFSSVLMALSAVHLFAAEPPAADISSILNRHCARCHGADEQEGDFRIDRLDRDIVGGPDADRWHEVLNRVNSGEMPPEDEPALTDDELAAFTDWLTGELKRAAAARRATDGRVVFRRLNRAEYNNTLNDLFVERRNYSRILLRLFTDQAPLARGPYAPRISLGAYPDRSSAERSSLTAASTSR